MLNRDATGALGRLPRGILLGFGLVAAGLALSWPTLFSPPLWDDHHFVVAQAFLRDPRHLAYLLDPRHLVEVLPVANAARPVWLASVLVDRALLGEAFAVHRLSSALWNAAGGCLLAAVAWELSADAAVSALAGLLFVVHPTHAETVNIVTFRADMLAFAFMALSILLHLRAGRSAKPALLRAGSLASFALALLSKESAAALPLLLPVIDALRCDERCGSVRRRLRVYAAFLLVLLAYMYFRVPRSGYVSDGQADVFSALYARAPALFTPVDRISPRMRPFVPMAREPMDPRPWSREMSRPQTRVRTMIAVQGSSLRRLFWPTPLQGDYAPKPALSWADPRVVGSLAGWILLAAVAAWTWRRRPLVALGLAWIPPALAPVGGAVWMVNMTADRYLYAASAGVCLTLAMLARVPSTRARRATLAAGCATAAFWAALWLRRAPSYQGDGAYFSSTLAVDPDVPRARANLALTRWDEGRFDEAERHFAQALRLWPEGRKVRRAYAAFLAERGRDQEARRLLAEAP